MKFEIEIKDSTIDNYIKKAIDIRLNEINIEKLIESKIATKVTNKLKENISNEKIDNYARDRVSRIITTTSINKFTKKINEEGVLSNLESKIILMMEKSPKFKKLVKGVLKSSL